MRMEREIATLKDLVRGACRSADICAAAAQASADPSWTTLLERLREDRRLLLVDLVRCLLLRGLPVPAVQAVMTEVVGPAEPDDDFDFLRVDLEIAERKLELRLRRALGDPLVSQATLELLSLHYLRLQLRLKELARPAGAADAEERPIAAVGALSRDGGARLLN